MSFQRCSRLFISAVLALSVFAIWAAPARAEEIRTKVNLILNDGTMLFYDIDDLIPNGTYGMYELNGGYCGDVRIARVKRGLLEGRLSGGSNECVVVEGLKVTLRGDIGGRPGASRETDYQDERLAAPEKKRVREKPAPAKKEYVPPVDVSGEEEAPAPKTAPKKRAPEPEEAPVKKEPAKTEGSKKTDTTAKSTKNDGKPRMPSHIPAIQTAADFGPTAGYVRVEYNKDVLTVSPYFSFDEKMGLKVNWYNGRHDSRLVDYAVTVRLSEGEPRVALKIGGFDYKMEGSSVDGILYGFEMGYDLSDKAGLYGQYEKLSVKNTFDKNSSESLYEIGAQMALARNRGVTVSGRKFGGGNMYYSIGYQMNLGKFNGR